MIAITSSQIWIISYTPRSYKQCKDLSAYLLSDPKTEKLWAHGTAEMRALGSTNNFSLPYGGASAIMNHL